MGRVYAGWGFSQAFYREELYKTLGFSSLEDFIVRHYEARFLKRNADDLMEMIWTIQHADISSNEIFSGNLGAALASIRAKALAMPSESDLYFPVEDIRREIAHVAHADLRVIPSVWGHRAGTPENNPVDAAFIFSAVSEWLRQ